MSHTIPLTAEEEAKLLAKARASGITPEQAIHQAIVRFLSSEVPPASTTKSPKPSLLGIWAHFGPEPSEEEIDQNRAEMFSTLGREDIP